MPEGWTSLLVTMGFTYVAFEGFEVIAQAGDEAIDPQRNLPKAMIYSVMIVTFIYVLVAFATVLPTEDVVSSFSIMFLFLFFMVNLCVIKIRRSMADELQYGYMMPLFPLFSILAIICQIVVSSLAHSYERHCVDHRPLLDH